MPTLTAALARECAANAVDAFEHYNVEFRAITRRAPLRFEARDWHASQRDAVERIELYDRYVDRTVAALRLRLGGDATDRLLWGAIKQEFERAIEALPDAEFRKTFFNSLTRRFFGTVGVSPAIEFVAPELDPLARVADYDFLNSYQNRGSLRLLLEEVLSDFRCRAPWRDFDRSIQHVAAEIERHCQAHGERRTVTRVEMIRPAFFQITRLPGRAGRRRRLARAARDRTQEHRTRHAGRRSHDARCGCFELPDGPLIASWTIPR